MHRPVDRPVHSPAPWWTALGRLLPREVRERVFEPACYERLHDVLANRTTRRAGVGVYAISVFVGTAGRNLPRIWFEGRRLSGLGRLAIAVGLTMIGSWMVLMVRYAYANY